MNLQNQLDYLPTLLDGVVVPSPLQANLVKSQIMLECGLLTPLYSEPYVMAQAITQWFAARSWTFDHLVKILQAEYSPIENVDRYDSTTTSMVGSEESSESESTGNTRNLSAGAMTSGTHDEDRSRSEIKNSGEDRELEHSQDSEKNSGQVTTTGDNTENTVSAFNASTYQPANNTSNLGSESIVSSETDSLYASDSETISRSESTSESESMSANDSESSSCTESENITGDRTNQGYTNRGQVTTFSQHLHGNIGVTTNQQMINQELDLLERFNVYGWIAKTFRADLILEVY